MANKAVALGNTSAAELDLNELRQWVNFVKLDTLIEVPFFITNAKLVPSSFDPSQTTAQISFEYAEPITPPVEDDEEDEGVYQFSTQQRAIKAQVAKWIAEGFDFEEHSIGPVTVTAYGEANSRGTYPLCIADVIEELSEPVRKDMREDATRQRLAGRDTVNTSKSAPINGQRSVPQARSNPVRTINPRKSSR